MKTPQCGPSPRLNILRVIISLFFLMNCLVCSITIALYQDWLESKQYYVISGDYLFQLTSSQVFSRDIISQRVGLAWLQLAPSSLFIQTVAPLSPASQGRAVPPVKDSAGQNVGQLWLQLRADWSTSMSRNCWRQLFYAIKNQLVASKGFGTQNTPIGGHFALWHKG